MSVQPALDTSYHPPTPVRALGPLLIPPHSVARKALDVCQGAFMDAAEALRRSREADARHDAYALQIERLALFGIRDTEPGTIQHTTFRAILQRNKALMSEDACEDSLIGAALVICRRLTAAIEKLFSRRARGSRP